MTDFYDWLTAADTGLRADRLAESFRLSHEELRRATEALAPAFTESLRRAMTDPGAVSALAASFAPFADPRFLGLGSTVAGDAARALTEQLLGPPERTASLARRASLTSGIAPDTLQRLMASLSVLTMETMTRMLVANVSRNQPALPDASGYGAAVAESMRRGANAVEALSRPSDEFGQRPKGGLPAGPVDLYAMFRDALTGRLPWLPPMSEPASQAASAPPAPKAGAPGTAPNTAPGFDPFLPFAAMMTAFARGLEASPAAVQGASAPGAAPTPAPGLPPAAQPAPRIEPPRPAAPPPAEAQAEAKAKAGDADASAPAPGDPVLAAIWESGRRMQADYVREMTALFSRYQQAAPHKEGEGKGEGGGNGEGQPS